MSNPVAQQRFDRAMQFLAESEAEPAREAARLEQARLDKIAAEEHDRERVRKLLLRRTLSTLVVALVLAIAAGSMFAINLRRVVARERAVQVQQAEEASAAARKAAADAAAKAEFERAIERGKLAQLSKQQYQATRMLHQANRDASNSRRKANDARQKADEARRNADAAVRAATDKAAEIQAKARHDLELARNGLTIARTQEKIAILAKQRAEFEAAVDARAADARTVERAHGVAIALAAAGSSLDRYHEVPPAVQNTLHDLLGGRLETRLLTGHSAPVTAVASCGRYVASGNDDGTVRVWEVDGKPLAKFKDGQQGSVTSIAFSPDCKRIITASKSPSSEIIPSAILYDIAGNRIGNTMKHRSDVNAVIFSPDGQAAVTGSADGLKLWDLRQPQFTSTTLPMPIPPGAGAITALAVAPGSAVPGSSWKFAAADFATVRIWDGSGKPMGTPFKHHSVVTSLSFTGNDIVYTDVDGNGEWLDASDGVVKRSFQVAPPSATALFPNGHGGAAANGGSDAIAVVNGESVRLAVLLPGMPFLPRDFTIPGSVFVTAVAFTSAGETLVTGDNTKVRLWKTALEEPPAVAHAGSTTLLRAACERLAVHPVLTEARATDKDARGAIETCLHYGWNAAQTTAFFIEQGRALAANGDVRAAANRFRSALARDPKLSFDPEQEAQRLATLAAP